MNPLKVVAYIAGLSVLFVTGFSWKDLRRGAVPNPAMIGAIGQKGPEQRSPVKVFSDEYQRIVTNFDDVLDDRQTLYAGLNGAMQSLGDPHTIFMEPVLAKEFSDSSQSKQFFGGIGARLMPDSMGVKVVQVFRNSPADKAGVRNGDIITAVNGKDVSGLTSDDIVQKIKGEIGTSVTITVFRGQNNSRQFSIVRDKIYPPSADGNVLEGTNVGYVLVTGFESLTSEQFDNVVSDLESKKVQGLVIDLRNNPGGLLNTAQAMLSRFVDYKPAVQIIGRGNHQETLMTDGGRTHQWKYPVMILVNEYSASASEIFSGCLQDYGLATLVGSHTYGKASVQNVIPLTGGASAKITIAHYRLPNGRDISRKQDDDGEYISGGIKPDMEVALDRMPGLVLGDPKTDNQLQKALELIKKRNPNAHAVNDSPLSGILRIEGGPQGITNEIQSENC